MIVDKIEDFLIAAFVGFSIGAMVLLLFIAWPHGIEQIGKRASKIAHVLTRVVKKLHIRKGLHHQ